MTDITQDSIKTEQKSQASNNGRTTKKNSHSRLINPNLRKADFPIHGNFPFYCAQPYLHSFIAEQRLCHQQDGIIIQCVNQLLLVVFITATANVLNSAVPNVYENYKAFRQFTNAENLQLPDFLNEYLSIIGKVRNKLGELEMPFAEVYLESWSTLAYQYSIRTRPANTHGFDYLLEPLPFPIWHSRKGVEFMIQKFCSYYNQFITEYPITTATGVTIVVQTPPMTPSNFRNYVIQPQYRYTYENRQELVHLFNIIRDWVLNNIPHEITIEGMRYYLDNQSTKQMIIDELSTRTNNLGYVHFIHIC